MDNKNSVWKYIISRKEQKKILGGGGIAQHCHYECTVSNAGSSAIRTYATGTVCSDATTCTENQGCIDFAAEIEEATGTKPALLITAICS